MTSASCWVSLPAGSGRKRHYFDDPQALRGYLYKIALADPSGEALRAARFPHDMPGADALNAWAAGVSRAQMLRRQPTGIVDTERKTAILVFAGGVCFGFVLHHLHRWWRGQQRR